MADHQNEGRHVQVHGQQGLMTRRGPGYGAGYGERFLLSLALVVVSLLWMTRDMAQWATVLCAVGAGIGVVGMLYFGRGYVRVRGNSR